MLKGEKRFVSDCLGAVQAQPYEVTLQPFLPLRQRHARWQRPVGGSTASRVEVQTGEDVPPTSEMGTCAAAKGVRCGSSLCGASLVGSVSALRLKVSLSASGARIPA